VTARRRHPETKDAAAVWRTAAKVWRCEGNGAARNKKFSARCTPVIEKGAVHLEWLDQAVMFQSGSRHCKACAREFFGGYL